MTPEEGKTLWNEIRANSAKVQECAGPHDLEEVPGQSTLNKRWRCKLCGGVIDTIAKLYYEQGLRHGRGSS